MDGNERTILLQENSTYTSYMSIEAIYHQGCSFIHQADSKLLNTEEGGRDAEDIYQR
jgi:hypothetical protein